MSFRFLGEPFWSRFMGHPLGAAPAAGGTYKDKVLALGPFAYWPLWETSGAIAYDIGPESYNGAYTGVTLGQTGIGDGRTAPFFDGANDYVNLHSVALATAWPWENFTMSIWLKVNSAAVWTDGIRRYAFYVQTNGTNFAYIAKADAANTLWVYCNGNGTLKGWAIAYSNADWFNVTLTVDVNAGVNGEQNVYINGASGAATLTALGTGVGAPLIMLLGANTTTPTFPWHGWQAHAFLVNRAITPAEATIIGSL